MIAGKAQIIVADMPLEDQVRMQKCRIDALRIVVAELTEALEAKTKRIAKLEAALAERGVML